MRAIEVVALLIGSCALACATSPTDSQGGEAPQTVRDLIERELDLSAAMVRKLVSTSGFRSAVPVPFELTVLDDDASLVQLEIGDAAPIECIVWSEEQELGTTAVRMADNTFKGYEESEHGLGDKHIAGLWAGAADGVAYHGLRWLYRVGPGVGTMKVVSANKDGRGIGCAHYQPGFDRTFIDVFSAFVENFEVESPPPEPYYSEVSVMTVGGQPVGVQSVRFTLDEDGDTRVDEESSSLMPRAADSLVTSFTKITSYARPDGSVINQHLVDSNADGLLSNLALKNDDGRWRVSGTYQEKDLDTGLAHEGPIDSTLAMYLALSKEFVPHGTVTSRSGFSWVPTADPTTVLETHTQVEPDDDRTVTSTVGPIRMTGVRDASGQIESGAIAMGRLEMTVERVSVEGGF